MELSYIANQIKFLFCYAYFGFTNYLHFKNFKTESWDIKDRLKSYNMKYPITKNFNQIFLSDARILYYLLIANFIFIVSAVLLRLKNFGYLIVLIFILNEFYFYNDILMSNLNNFNTIKSENLLEVVQKIPIDIATIISLIFGVLFITSKNYKNNDNNDNGNKLNTNKAKVN